MPPKGLSSRHVIRMLREDGWAHIGTEGSHWQFKHPMKPGRVTVQHPRRDLPKWILRSIYDQAGWEWMR
ncbi:MAG: type II toxin-antitoxin system HicA family toxin [Alphaproteobacteria bacterium]|nr:type II toxin-antitoxin system HicA family toxin [Alphaproteobacteria bacterium]